MTFEYVGMPVGDNWLDNIPPRYLHGRPGFDIRICRELDELGIRCYTINQLASKVRTTPPAVPMVVDWLAHLEEKVPGPETEHRAILRTGFIKMLMDPAARGNTGAIDALFEQFYKTPPVPEHVLLWASDALKTIAERTDYPRVVTLLDDLTVSSPKRPLLEYLGKFKTDDAKAVVVPYLDDLTTRSMAVKALTQMKARGVRHLIAPLVDDANSEVRKFAKRAMDRLPAM